MTEGQSWQPMLTGPRAAAAQAAVMAIAESLYQTYGHDVDGRRPAGLESGRAGAAVFFRYLDRSDPSHAYAELAPQLLHDAVTVTDPGDLRGLLQPGSIGVAWAAAHLARMFEPQGVPAASAAFLEAVDAALVEMLSTPWTGACDLISGLVGFGIYALERFPCGMAVQSLELIVQHLVTLAQPHPAGLAWRTDVRADSVPEDLCDTYTLGMAHGVAGVLALLGHIHAVGVAANAARTLLDGGIRWLLAQSLPAELGSHFGRSAGPGAIPEPTRQTWCHGDLGIATALYLAARGVGNVEVVAVALGIARDVATQPFAPELVRDPNLCHGAIGNGHLFARLWHATSDRTFHDAATAWLERGLAMRRPGARLGGFSNIEPATDGGALRRVAYRGMLFGVTGIGLGLLAATNSVEPAWDRALMMS